MTSPIFPPLQNHSPGRWTATVGDALSTGPEGRRHMFGGTGLALAVMALEQLSGRPALWASAQFLAPVPAGSVLLLEGQIVSAGHVIAHGELRGSVGGEAALTALGSFGDRADSNARQWSAAPIAPPPRDCAEVNAHRDADLDIHSTLEVRVARGRFGIFSREPTAPGGVVEVWMRHRHRPNDRIALAFMADFVPSVVGNALDMRAGGNSLDNNIRYCGNAETGWVMGRFAIEAVVGGIGHGRVELFAEDGTLLALASQSFKLRAMPRTGEAV